MDRSRQLLLGGLLVVLIAASGIVLATVLEVILFAITVGYMLYPLRERLANRGLSARIASGIATTVAFLVVIAVALPMIYVLYSRRMQLIEAITEFPDSISFSFAGRDLMINTDPIVTSISETGKNLAVDAAVAVPRLALELTLFTLLVYGLLYRPQPIRNAVYEVTPTEYHDIVTSLHERTRTTLYSIYVLQALTALGTAIIAAVVFLMFGYEAWFSLAFVSGLLQFIPIIGPSVLIALLALGELLSNDPVGAAFVFGVGIVLVGFVPDAIVRTQLADRTGELPASLYFVGFVGGILTVGTIGVLAGPLVVALLVEVVELLAERGEAKQTSPDVEPTDEHSG